MKAQRPSVHTYLVRGTYQVTFCNGKKSPELPAEVVVEAASPVRAIIAAARRSTAVVGCDWFTWLEVSAERLDHCD